MNKSSHSWRGSEDIKGLAGRATLVVCDLKG